jgi:phosphotransferase system HPr (HPr) family protein
MTSSHIIVRCEHGLHARVAAQVVNVVLDHESVVHIRCGNCPKASACSILELITLGAREGARIEILAEGPDESAVLAALEGVFEGGGGV